MGKVSLSVMNAITKLCTLLQAAVFSDKAPKKTCSAGDKPRTKQQTDTVRETG